MNYIKGLQMKLDQKYDRQEERKEIIDEYIRYLRSKKFHQQTTVETWEVLDMLYRIRSHN